MDMLKGIFPIVAATFDDYGKVDYESLKNLIGTLLDGGCSGATLFGIASEYYKLNDEEKKKMAAVMTETCREHNGKSVLSVTEHSTECAVEQAKYYESLGADCLMLLPPFFLKPGANAVAEHIKTVADAVKIPVMPQYAPEQTGVSITPEVFNRLCEECKNILYYKIECKPSGPYISEMVKSSEKVGIFIGNAGFQLIEGLERGAVGAMPGASMFDIYVDIYNNYAAGRRSEAVRIHSMLLPMLNHIRQNVEQIILYEKKILKMRGIIKSDYCRKPSYKSDECQDKIFMEFFDLLAESYGWKRS